MTDLAPYLLIVAPYALGGFFVIAVIVFAFMAFLPREG